MEPKKQTETKYKVQDEDSGLDDGVDASSALSSFSIYKDVIEAGLRLFKAQKLNNKNINITF